MTLPAPSARPDEIVREMAESIQRLNHVGFLKGDAAALLACADAYGREEEERQRLLRAATTEPGTVADQRDHPKPYSTLEKPENRPWDCRVCGFGVFGRALDYIRIHGHHQNALGHSAKNDGTAYCPYCTDETLRNPGVDAPQPRQAGRCQDCGQRDKYRVNHPSGPLCYACVRERILSEAQPRQAWQPIDSAPKDRPILATDWAHLRPRECRWWQRGENNTGFSGWYPTNPNSPRVHPTHWMPLPDPPLPASSSTQKE